MLRVVFGLWVIGAMLGLFAISRAVDGGVRDAIEGGVACVVVIVIAMVITRWMRNRA